MPDDTSHHEVIACVLKRGSIVGSRCDTTSSALEDEGEQVAQDEDPGVPSCLQAGELVTNFEDNVFEGQVDAGSDESRADDQAANLYLEAVF